MQPAAIVLVSSGSRPPTWLVVRRPETPHEWAIPGGGVERGETPLQTGIREIMEETGIQITTASPLGLYVEHGRPVYVLLATSWQGRARPAEGWPVTWLSWTQLRAQAQRFGPCLDAIAATLRARGVAR